jgi:hypothetical protein
VVGAAGIDRSFTFSVGRGCCGNSVASSSRSGALVGWSVVVKSSICCSNFVREVSLEVELFILVDTGDSVVVSAAATVVSAGRVP